LDERPDPSHFRNARHALIPPNPNEFESAHSAELYAVPACTNANAASGVSTAALTRLSDGGKAPFVSARQTIAASIAPLAPSGWPYRGLVPLTGTAPDRSPKTVWIASASARSPSGVELPCAFT